MLIAHLNLSTVRYGRAAVLGISLLSAVTARAQQTETPRDSTLDLGSILYSEHHGGLKISSGKTYNRVEGLPLYVGPTYKDRIGHANLSMGALGIIRSADNFHWDPDNLGHRLSADLRIGAGRGFAVGAVSFDEVTKVEPWHLTEPDGGLAAFFLKRDYFDYFGRHGARAYASAFASTSATLTFGVSKERWSSRSAREVYAFLRGKQAWRDNPRVNDGVMHLADLSFTFDSRNREYRPWAGWYLTAQYEHGSGNLDYARTVLGPDDILTDIRPVSYGRLFMDLRRYNRISPRLQLNARLVLGGWLYGDPLPLERRFSLGGVGTLPGFDFRRIGIGTDVGQCGPETGNPGRPAQCERVALTQIEYRHELASELIDLFNRKGIRVRGSAFRVRPAAVAFVDAGRGWLVGSRQGELRYPSGSLPGFDTWRTDAGLGFDLGIAGLYVAKALSPANEPANFFVRVRRRF